MFIRNSKPGSERKVLTGLFEWCACALSLVGVVCLCLVTCSFCLQLNISEGAFHSAGGGGVGGLPYKNNGGACHIFLGVEKEDLVPIRLFSLKRSTAGAFTVPSRATSQKKSLSDNVLF